MIAIVLSACLAGDPGQCRTFKIPLMPDVSPEMCAMYAPPHFGAWAEDHPGWTIKSWHCRPVSLDDI